MRKTRLLVIPLFLLFTLGCGLVSGVQNIQKIKNEASTQLPSMLTSAPTAQVMLETMAAVQSAGTCTGTPTAGGLGISMSTAKTVLQMSQEFTLANGTADGQPVVTATLTSTGAATFPAISQGFSAQFIGDACNLSRITVTIPRSDQQASVDQGISALNLVLTGTLPAVDELTFVTWLTQNYSNLAVSGQKQTTITTLQFTLQRTQTSMIFNVLPAQ
ncbi:MAG: hypothetical protein WCE68_12360 [Anaerolineales bacterium]